MATMQVFAPVLAVTLLIGVFTSIPTGVQSIGVCYGVIGNDLPPHSDVVQLYKSKGISNMRLYLADGQTLDALRGSGIGLVVGVANGDVGGLAANQSSAASWVETNVKPYYPAVNITYIAVGNEIVDGATQSILAAAMRNLNDALVAAGLGGIKVTTSVRLDVIANSFPPSSGVFKDPSVMVPISKFLASTGAPVLANVYPYFAYKANPVDIKLNYTLFLPGTAVNDSGNGLIYTNIFDAMVDAIYAVLEKAGTPNVTVVVSESGWPSAGGFAASVANARTTYIQNLIDHVAHGTPKKPAPIEAYVFALFNENQKPGELTERKFGLFYPNKSSVYPIIFQRKLASNPTQLRG